MQIEPISEAAFNKPKPSGPTLKISLAYTGTIATAPPKNTAKRSSETAPSNSFVLKTKCKPCFTLSQIFFSPDHLNAAFRFNEIKK